MKPPFRFLYLLLPGCILCHTGYAQQNPRKEQIESINAMFALQLGVPSKEMQEAIKNNMGNLGFGGSVVGLFNPFTWGKNKRNSFVWIGAEAGYTYYGRFLTEVDVNGTKGDFKTSYGILHANAILRFRTARKEFVNPFFEVLAGGSFYLSRIKENLGLIESSLGISPIDFENYSSGSFNKGLAVGFSIGKPEEEEPRFTLRASYNRGNSITYVVRNSLQYNASANRMEYYIGKAPVSYFLIQLGIGI